MMVFRGGIARFRRYSRWQLVWRTLLAVPFALSLGLALVLGPATINSRYGSFLWLAFLSLVAALLMLGVRERLLIPVGLVALVVFPVVAGLGFHYAPDWARPAVWVIFYGSIVASAGAALIGIVALVRSVSRAHPRAVAIAAGCLVLVVLVVVAGVVSGPSAVTEQVAGDLAGPVNMGRVINTAQREAEPSFTADGRTMVFNCNGIDICVSHLTGTWEEAGWTPAELLGPPISTAYVEVEPLINASGDKLYFNSWRPFPTGESIPGLAFYVHMIGFITTELGVTPFGGLGHDDIWVSYLADGVWSEPRNLNDVPGEPPVNTEFADHCLFFSADGNEAFWTSTRPGGLGGNDIWTSRRVDGRWTEPENLGPNVNGPASDHHSIPTPDGRTLYVTSARAGGFGGEDIYTTTRGADGTWGPLVNLGPLVNGPGNDRCPAWTPDGRILLFDSVRPGGFGSLDLWWIYSEEVTSQAPRGA